jgi:hypothetical protein
MRLFFVRRLLATALVFATIFTLLTAAPSSADNIVAAPGQQTTAVVVAGHTLTCDAQGRPVIWVADYGLGDAGRATPSQGPSPYGGVIRYNPSILNTMPDDLKTFWLGHECAHLHLPTAVESEADCWSAQTGVQQGWFTPQDADSLAQSLANNPGDETHPPGPERVDHVKQCMASARASGSGTSANLPTSTVFDSIVSRLIEEAPKQFSDIRGNGTQNADVPGTTFYDYKPAGLFKDCRIQLTDDPDNNGAVCSFFVGTHPMADDATGNADDASRYQLEYNVLTTFLKSYARHLGVDVSTLAPKNTAEEINLPTVGIIAPNGSIVSVRGSTDSRSSTGRVYREVELDVDQPS